MSKLVYVPLKGQLGDVILQNQMKKIILTLVLSALIIPAISSAQNSTSSIKDRIGEIKQQRDELKNKINQEKESIKIERASTTEIIKNKRQEIKSEIEQRIGKKLDEKRTNIANKFEEAIKNLKDLLARVETKITKVESRNPNATSTIGLLVTAKENVTLAETALTTLKNKLAETISTSTKKAYLAGVKSQSDKTKETIKTAHKSIIDIIESLKPGLLKERATSTKESTSTNNI